MDKKENMNSSHNKNMTHKNTSHNVNSTHHSTNISHTTNVHKSTVGNHHASNTKHSVNVNQHTTNTHKSISGTHVSHGYNNVHHNTGGNVSHGHNNVHHNTSGTHVSHGHNNVHYNTSGAHVSHGHNNVHHSTSHGNDAKIKDQMVINNTGRLSLHNSSTNTVKNTSINVTPKSNNYGVLGKHTFAKVVAIILFWVVVLSSFSLPDFINDIFSDDDFVIISTIENKDMEKELVRFGNSKGIDIKFEYAEDLDAVSLINQGGEYDAIWASNSLWLYQIEKYPLRNSKSISINPVVLAIKKNKANALGFTNREITNAEVIDAISNGRINYVMSSIVKSNSGASSYLGFLNSLAGSPEVLKSEMLYDPVIRDKMVSFFSQVERVSGTETFLEDMFLKSDNYDAVIAAETALIRINQELEKAHKEPLYLLYPSDGVALSDSPFAYVDRGQEKLEEFDVIQKYLLSKKMQKKLEDSGRRTWYGGVNAKANPKVFNKEWGIDTTKYLIPQKYPSKKVINEATSLYVEEFRKPSHTIFLLDYSGSMTGIGNSQLVDAMNYILNYETASKDFIQFVAKDKITVIPFTDTVNSVWTTENGRMVSTLLSDIQYKTPGGGTNIYNPAVRALDILEDESDEYSKTIVLMTDGQSIYDFDYLKDYYDDSQIPIYSIMFGDADPDQLEEIAELTNAKVFDGSTDLVEAFKEVRSFS